MLEKYVRRKKNRTRTMRILENMKRPTVIVNPLSAKQTEMLDDALNAWRIATGMHSVSIYITEGCSICRDLKPASVGASEKKTVEDSAVRAKFKLEQIVYFQFIKNFY